MGATRLQTALRVVVPAAHLGHRGRVHPGHLARRRRDDDRRRRRRHAAEPDVQPARAGRDDHRLHRAGRLGDLPHGSIGYQTIFAAGLTLMLLTLVFNLIGYCLRKRFREAY